MTRQNIKKLQNALDMMKKAEAMIGQVAKADKSFMYSPNANFRENRISAAIHIIETEISQIQQ